MKTLAQLIALCVFGGTVSSHERTAAKLTEDGTLWITLREECMDLLHRNPSALSSGRAPEVLGGTDGILIASLPAGDLGGVADLIHTNAKVRGCFTVHESFSKAENALAISSLESFEALQVSLTINQARFVNNLFQDLQELQISATIKDLSSFNNRYYLSSEGETSSLWVRDKWLAYAGGRADVTVDTYDHTGYGQKSVILTIAGATVPDEVVILGGHLDSAPPTNSPGADDNASGIACLSEVIRVLMLNNFIPDRTVKFMGYAAEEVGLYGSGDIAQDHRNLGIDVVAVLQLDMTGFKGPSTDIVMISDYTSAALNDFVVALVEAYQSCVDIAFEPCGYGCSDHASWHREQYPATFPFEALDNEYNPYIHTSSDTADKLSTEHSMKFAKLALSFAVEIGLINTMLPVCIPNEVCENGEDCQNCPQDCPSLAIPPLETECGNGLCEAGDGENCENCVDDCNKKENPVSICCGFDVTNEVGCGNSKCTTGGYSCTESPVGGGGGSTCCGDGICESPENSTICALDCDLPCTPSQSECSNIGDKGLCNAEPSCRYDNQNKVCVNKN